MAVLFAIILIIAGIGLGLHGFGRAASAQAAETVMHQVVFALWTIEGALGIVAGGLGAILLSHQRGIRAIEEIGSRLNRPRRARSEERLQKAPPADRSFDWVRGEGRPPTVPSYDR
jgi:hypothetical protein